MIAIGLNNEIRHHPEARRVCARSTNGANNDASDRNGLRGAGFDAGEDGVFHREAAYLFVEGGDGFYARELRTPVPVSVKRLQKQWEGMAYG